ncbi:thiolase family protein [Oceanobacillus sp. 1P07AA]|uniref:thiolase family protein n=1 Tax=Oceanobacillus sp. 1P07AA TaxID=3132293 RepID=UPI0039A61D75
MNNQENEAVIVEAVRLPVGKRDGVYAETRSEYMLSTVLEAVMNRTSIARENVDDVIVGCVTQNQEQGNNIARIASLIAGYPESVPGMTINRKCGSSQQAVHLAVQSIISGDCDTVVAAGIENMTRQPIGSDTNGLPDELIKTYDWPSLGLAADRIAEKWELSRSELDEFAVRSHILANEASERGLFQREITPIEVEKNGEKIIVKHDEGIRANTSTQKLATLKPSFQENGKITAGNSSQISDGASAILVMSKEKAQTLGVTPRARIIASDVIGCDPKLMLTGTIPITKRILQKANLTMDDIDIFECNEAFSSVILAWMKELNPKIEKVNPRGGAIALGHPTGASGARIMTTLLHELEDSNHRFGLQVMCCGGGMATASIMEVINS